MDNNQPEVVLQQPSIPVDPPLDPEQPKKNSKRTFLIGGILLAVILLVILMGLFLLKKQIPLRTFPTPTPVPSQTVSPTGVIPTAGNPVIQLSLVKGKSIVIPDSDVTIQYSGQSAPNPKCVDCSTTTDIVLTKQNIAKKLSYMCGGIAGTCSDKLSAYGYDVSLGATTETTTVAKIQKK